MDSHTHEVLIWKHIQSEKVADYKHLLQELLSLGYTILSVTIDGKRGVSNVFKDYPVQMCHFHQKRIVQIYITLRPKLEASQKLQKIMSRLKYSDEVRFKKALDIWHLQYKDFLNEITIIQRAEKNHLHTKSLFLRTEALEKICHIFLPIKTIKNYQSQILQT